MGKNDSKMGLTNLRTVTLTLNSNTESRVGTSALQAQQRDHSSTDSKGACSKGNPGRKAYCHAPEERLA